MDGNCPSFYYLQSGSVYQSSWAAITKTGGLNNRNVVAHGSGD